MTTEFETIRALCKEVERLYAKIDDLKAQVVDLSKRNANLFYGKQLGEMKNEKAFQDFRQVQRQDYPAQPMVAYMISTVTDVQTFATSDATIGEVKK